MGRHSACRQEKKIFFWGGSQFWSYCEGFKDVFHSNEVELEEREKSAPRGHLILATITT